MKQFSVFGFGFSLHTPFRRLTPFSAFGLELSALKQRLRRFNPNRTISQIHGVQIPMDAFLILSGLLLFLMAMAVGK
jgi:hypothetical protein